MTSRIKVMESPENMGKAFNAESDLYSIRLMQTVKNFDNVSDTEWERLKKEPTLYKVTVRHAEYKTGLSETRVYSSWKKVENALQRKAGLKEESTDVHS